MDIFNQISNALIDGEEDIVLSLIRDCIKRDIDVNQIIEEGLSKGIKQVGYYFEEGEYFLPELMQGAEIMKAAMKILNPIIESTTDLAYKSKGKVLIGTVEGDIHDIGKTLVASMLTASGYDVHDMGADVKFQDFLFEIQNKQFDILCLSALLTSTMLKQKEIISKLTELGLRDDVIIIVGGAPVSMAWAKEIGADGYAENAVDAVNIVNTLLQHGSGEN